MMQELYYDDSLVSAYMLRTFEVKILRDPKCVIAIKRFGEFYNVASLASHSHNQPYTPDKYYISKDSYHVFQPQIGDLIEHDERFGIYDSCGQLSAKEMDDTVCYNIRTDDYKIIQRNNKQFFMPKEDDKA